MSKNLLAVDDSATMRKVLEITFSGEDFLVSAAADRAGAMAKLGESPSVVVIDTSLAGDDGYAIAKEVRSKLPRAVLLLLASRYNPYDAAKGKDAGADDYMDKPFDTQQMIDKVRKLLSAKEAGGPAVAAAAPVAAAPVAPPMAARPVAPSPPSPPVAPKPYAPGAAQPRSGTLMFSVDGPPMPAITGPANTAQTAAPPPAAPEPKAPHAPPPPPHAPPPPAAHAPVAAAPAAAVSAPVNGHMAAKLGELGLSAAQADAVMALSREVVERVVWEVVPQLAEAIIKEEIARLTKEG